MFDFDEDTEFDSDSLEDGTDIKSAPSKSKKRVCFEADDLLVKVFEFSRDEDGSWFPEEQEPCDSLDLTAKLRNLSVNSATGTRHESNPLCAETDKSNFEPDERPQGSSGDFIHKPPTSVPLDRGNTSARKTKKRVRLKKGNSNVSSNKLLDSSQENQSPKTSPVQNKEDPSQAKSDVESRVGVMAKPNMTTTQSKSRKPETKSTNSRINRKRDSGGGRQPRRERASSGLRLKKSSSVDTHLAAVTDLRRPRSCSSLPSLHLSPHRPVAKRDFPVSARTITFPDFVSPTGEESRSRSATRVESASWARMSFISRDNSPPPDRRDNFTGPSGKMYSWKVANGMIRPVDLTTPSIAPLWENLTSNPGSAGTNSVMSAL